MLRSPSDIKVTNILFPICDLGWSNGFSFQTVKGRPEIESHRRSCGLSFFFLLSLNWIDFLFFLLKIPLSI